MNIPRNEVANDAPRRLRMVLTAHSPYARDAPDFVISETRIPSNTRKIQILILSPNLLPMMVKVVSTAFSGWKPV